ncbi:hypothetical protein EDF56_105110 [Novosphingobium sp. PhB165]|uniref:hypothetical protein n=1 Tax=Novosphingobium sp. PhB165 TaxID=2485105 RepID=UPI0010502AF2|nr:hypothetical protein [Novosphingobium sp. PhB165]TCM17767.1 hypothetical protein EDF56_105110 [Novosphingobium sp. PhB165]
MSLPYRPAAIVLPALAALALTGCHKQEEASNKAASGAALLSRSVTDDMPPYDTVRSQNPHMAPEESAPSARRAAPADASEAPADSDADAAAAAAADVEAAQVKPAGE